MDIRELEIFLTLADLLHFNKTSQACNMSPSALTRTIQRLEDQVGQTLFLRNNRTVSLSSAGEKFRVYARQVMQDWQTFQATMNDEQAVTGSLSIYASITAVYSLLPHLLESYRSTYPMVHIELRTGAAEQSVLQVQTGEIDLAVAALPDRNRSSIEFLPITTTPLVFIAPIKLSTPPSKTESGQLDLNRTPLVLPQTGSSRHRLNQWMKKNRVTPIITSEVSGNEAIIPMVTLGCGIGIVPKLVLDRSPFRNKVVILEDTPQLDPYVVGLCSTKRNLQRASVYAFWQLATQESI